ncbi:MurR/RpiR family transcriptional regulator [Candidatus Epulonipiscium viviparus]|uniref:MurR/RpiR family transcriptional regulator n=1 Tax=Candidatus Epulonipiscium viviparus TaxID=420336 RepID=UPI0027380D7E|nr:MurR/RpiR family transcriptional regulator [Candidatus Epulopiscium viviparus]
MKQYELIQRIKSSQSRMSKGQRLIANYIINHYEKAVYLTAAKLGQIVGVSESTVVRFATELGYDGYPKFQAALVELVKSKLTAMQRIEVTHNRIDQNHVLKSVLQIDEEKIRHTAAHINEETFDGAITAILNAKTIYILGVRSCAGLATFLHFYLNIMFENVKVVNTNSISEIFEVIHRINTNDVIIGISFPRYSKRVYRSLEFAKGNGATIIGITDSVTAPIAEFSDYCLVAKSEMISFVDSLVAPLSIINALIVALSLKIKDSLEHSLDSLEKIWVEYEVYDDTKDFFRENYDNTII